MLAADEGGLDVVDPDEIRAGEGNGITSPDILWVELGNVDVLDDDVLGSICDSETLSTDHCVGSDTNDGLVGAEVDTRYTSLVVCDRDGWLT